MSFNGIENFEGCFLGGLSADLSPWDASQKIEALAPWSFSNAYIQIAINDMYQQGYVLDSGKDNQAISNWPSVFSAALNNASWPWGTSDDTINTILQGMKRAGLIFTRRTSTYAGAAREELVSWFPDVPGRVPVTVTAGAPIVDSRDSIRVSARDLAASRKSAEDKAIQVRLSARGNMVPGPSAADNALTVLSAGISVAQQIQNEKLERQRQQQVLIEEQIASGTLPRRIRTPRGFITVQPQVQSNPVGYVMIGAAVLGAIYLLASRK